MIILQILLVQQNPKKIYNKEYNKTKMKIAKI